MSSKTEEELKNLPPLQKELEKQFDEIGDAIRKTEWKILLLKIEDIFNLNV